MNVKIKLMENGKMPEFKRAGDACLDCYAAEAKIIEPGKRSLINLGFALELPEGYEGVIRPRSGLSSKGIDGTIGTIDSNYRGELKGNIINNTSEPYSISFGDRICQLAIRKTEEINFIQVEELNDTVRGADGFGSSGK